MKKNKIVLLLVSLLLLSTLSFAEQGQKVDLIPLDFGIKTSIVSVGNTPTPIPATALPGRKSIMIKNLDAVTIYIGTITCTADTAPTGGFPLAQNEVFKGDIGENTIIYGITTSSANASVIEVR
jgi:hypothetical protein